MPESTLKTYCRKNNLKPPTEVLARPSSKYHFRKKELSQPSYGFTTLQGKVVIEPKEYETLLMMKDLKQQGHSSYQIQKILNSEGKLTRLGKKWSYQSIDLILKRNAIKAETKNVEPS
ncbi:MAG: recombinase family protein [Bdellovibrionales bacterium]|nr:recombinase family protein [Bdellovibrionales bacterium]